MLDPCLLGLDDVGLTLVRVQQFSTIRFAVHGITGAPLARLPYAADGVRLSFLAASVQTCIAKNRACSKAQCRIRTNVGVASVLWPGERRANGSMDCFRSEFRTVGSWYDTCCPQASSEVPESRMHRFVSMKQSCECARARVPAPGPARRRNSDHSGRCELIAMASVAEVREHVPRRAESLDHWRLRWRASLARSRLRKRRSRAAHEARRHQHRTKRAEALRSTVDPGCGDSNPHIEAPPPLWRLNWHNHTLLNVGHAQVSEMLADSAMRATFPLRESRRCAPRRAESQPGADLGPNRKPRRSPRQRAPSSRITELSTRQSRCVRAPRRSIGVRGFLEPPLLRGAYPFRAHFGRA